MDFQVQRLDSFQCPSCGVDIDTQAHKPLSVAPCDKCNAIVKIPAAFGNFQLTKVLGRGTSGVVFQSVDEQLQREVAIKILATGDQDADTKALECVSEARALAALNDPNIVHIYSIGKHENQHFIVMELVTGGTAEELLEDYRRPSVEEATSFGLGMAKGLRAANAVGLIHMDIKPGNVLLTADSKPKIIDFGAAHLADSDEIVGTPYYIAPEVAQGKKPDFKADIYSLGATLYHLIVGEPPFTGETPEQVIRRRYKEPPPALSKQREGVTFRLDQLVNRMMARNKADRFDTYDELVAEFEATLEEIQSGIEDPTGVLAMATGGGPAVAGGTRLGEQKKPPVALIVGGLVAALVATVAMVFAFTGGEPEVAEQSLTPDPALKSKPTPKKPAFAPQRDPVAFWPLDQDAGDLSSNGLHGKAQGKVVFQKVGGRGTAAFNGPFDHITAPAPIQLAGNPAMTVVFDLVYKPSPKPATVLSMGTDSKNKGFEIRVAADGKATIGFVDGATHQVDLKPHAGKRVQLTTIYDVAAAKLITFINDKQAGITSTFGRRELDVSGGVRIGKGFDPTDGSFAGTIGSVRLYNRALRHGEMMALAGIQAPTPDPVVTAPDPKPTPKPIGPPDYPKPPIAHWSFDSGAADSAGQHDLTFYGDATIAKHGSRGNVLKLSGKGYAKGPAGFANFTEGMTVAAWLHPIGVNTWTSAHLIDFGNGKPKNNLIVGQNDKTRDLGIWREGGGGKTHRILAKNILQGRKWIHFAATFDAQGNVRIYKNGKLASTGRLDRMPENVTRQNIFIAKNAWGDQYAFKGMIDELYIYDGPLSAKQINELKNQPPQTDLPVPKVATVVPDAANPKPPQPAPTPPKPTPPPNPYAKDWVTLKPTKAEATKGPKLTVRPGGAVLISGTGIAGSTYTLTMPVDGPSISALRLKGLRHDSLAGRGPGRGTGGLFLLTQITATVAPKDDPTKTQPIKFIRAEDDQAIKGFDPKALIDGKARTNWGIRKKRQADTGRAVTLMMDKPTDHPGGGILQITMANRVNLGFFRWLATANSDAAKLQTPQYTPPPDKFELFINFGHDKPHGRDGVQWKTAKPYKPGGHGFIGGEQKTRSGRGNKDAFKDKYLIDFKALKFTVPKSKYRVVMYFSDPGATKIGQRVTAFRVEGKVLTSNFDIFAEAGGKRGPLVTKAFDIRVTDGVLDIEAKGVANKPLITAISVQSVGKIDWDP